MVWDTDRSSGPGSMDPRRPFGLFELGAVRLGFPALHKCHPSHAKHSVCYDGIAEY